MLRLWIDSDCYIKITLFWETGCYSDTTDAPKKLNFFEEKRWIEEWRSLLKMEAYL